ncbi:MAG TPA: hypothetical protein VE090_00865 [Methylomirabilota bacterium]|nr:hypothetical protein [Methylomirabilota bacterium]
MSEPEQEFSFKSLFSPLTNLKAIHIIVFFNALSNGFVWDDKTYIILNNDVHSLNIPKLIGNNIFNQSQQYRPLLFRDMFKIHQELQLLV